MATKKDLVEAYSFSRRRLVTAFVSGAPGGREVEPNRPGRTIVGGLALAVLLVAGGAVLGILKSPTTIDWTQEGLVSEKETGADYLVLQVPDSDDTELRPLANITSAMLIFGSELAANDVPRDEIAERDRGAPIGILGAPATPPEPSTLIQDHWTGCTAVPDEGAAGIRVDLSTQSAVELTPDASFVVRTASGGFYVIAQSAAGTEGRERGYAYEVPGSDREAILQAVAQTGGSTAVEVPDQFVTLFPAGRPLALGSFGLRRDQLGQSWPGRDGVPGAGGAEIGDLLVVGEAPYLLTAEGQVRLDAFSRAVYDALSRPPADPTQVFEAAGNPDGALDNLDDVQQTRWPAETAPARTAGELCAQLDVAGAQPGVLLGTTAGGSDASAEDVVGGAPDPTVDPGHGAFALVGDWDDAGPATPVLIDDRGFQNPVGTGTERDNLGYGDVDDVLVPQQWIALFRPGVPLTLDAARCPPSSDPERSSCRA